MKRFLACCFLLVLGGCDSPLDEVAPVDPIATVETATATRATIDEELTLFGRTEIDPAAARTLSLQTESQLTQIFAPVGTIVEAGAQLVAYIPSSAGALDRVKATNEAAFAQTELARQQRLLADGLASEADVALARQTYTAARATVESLGSRPGSHAAILHAPVAGIVDKLDYSPGDVVPSGAILVRVAPLDRLRARFGVESKSLESFAVGQDIAIATMDRRLSLTTPITAIDPRIDPVTRTASVLTMAGPGFAPGEPIRGIIKLASHSLVISIPRNAVLEDLAGAFVFVVRAGHAYRTSITRGIDNGVVIEIGSGLNEGDTVVTVGGSSLSEGMAVTSAAPATAP